MRTAAYLAPSTQTIRTVPRNCKRSRKKLLEEIAELKVPLTEVQDLKKLRDIRCRCEATGTEKQRAAREAAHQRKSCWIRQTEKNTKNCPGADKTQTTGYELYNRHLPFPIENVSAFLFQGG